MALITGQENIWRKIDTSEMDMSTGELNTPLSKEKTE